MVISDVKVYTVKPRWIFIKIITDDGLEGWGELVSGTKTETVVAGVKEMSKRIIGRNPLEIEKIWGELYRVFFRSGPINIMHQFMNYLGAELETRLKFIRGLEEIAQAKL